MNKVLRCLLFLVPLLFAACGKDEPKNSLFSFNVLSNLPETEISLDGTECGISAKGTKQTIKIELIGDFDTYNLSANPPSWIQVSTNSNTIVLDLPEYMSEAEDMRSDVVGFTVFKGSSSATGRIIVHQYAEKPAIPTKPVSLSLDSPSLWETYGVPSSLSFKYFNKEKNIPSDFTYPQNSYTGFGGVYLINNLDGYVQCIDASCPNEGNSNVIVEINHTLFEAVCPVCKSHFDIKVAGGLPISGPAFNKRLSLKKYNTTRSNGGYIFY